MAGDNEHNTDIVDDDEDKDQYVDTPGEDEGTGHGTAAPKDDPYVDTPGEGEGTGGLPGLADRGYTPISLPSGRSGYISPDEKTAVVGNTEINLDKVRKDLAAANNANTGSKIAGSIAAGGAAAAPVIGIPGLIAAGGGAIASKVLEKTPAEIEAEKNRINALSLPELLAEAEKAKTLPQGYQTAMPSAGDAPAARPEDQKDDNTSSPVQTAAQTVQDDINTRALAILEAKRKAAEDEKRRVQQAYGQTGFTGLPPVSSAASSTNPLDIAATEIMKMYPGAKTTAPTINPIDISGAANPTTAEGMKQLNDMLVGVGQQGKLSQSAITALQNAPKLTEENKDAWLKYYNPEQYQSKAALAQASQGTATSTAADKATAAQAGFEDVQNANLISGMYEGDTSRLGGYDPTIEKSAQRADALAALEMSKKRALGVTPSIASEQYRQSLDDLSKQQASAAAGVRGPDRILALRNVAEKAAEMGQKAVRDVAILRMEEQLNAEKMFTEQANAIMLEDQRVASQEKVNQLNQLTAWTEAELKNATNRLEKDRFNADSLNKVNELRANLKNQQLRLNAELQNNVNLQNAENQTQVNLQNARLATEVSQNNAKLLTEVSLQNAAKTTDVDLQNALNVLNSDKWAGDQAQKSLLDWQTQARKDIADQYGVGRDWIDALTGATKTTGQSLMQSGAAEAGNATQLQQLADVSDRWNKEQEGLRQQREAAQQLAYVQTGLAAGKTLAEILAELTK